jgi:hypothetical protein
MEVIGMIKENAQIFDMCCGVKAMYFHKNHPLVLYSDQRKEEKGFYPYRENYDVNPDVINDFRNLPYEDESFYHVIFDPPHLFKNPQVRLTIPYGHLNKDTWKDDIRKGFQEGWRILKQGGTMIMKWNEMNISRKNLLKILPQNPIYGHPPKSKNKTHWMIFYKEVKS